MGSMKKKKLKIKKPVIVSLAVVLGIAIMIFITMLLFNVTDYGITIASFGATIFMIISKGKFSKRKIFGSYIIATAMGFAFSRASSSLLNVALAAVTSVILMTFLEFQHAPAIGMSIAMVLNRFSFWTDAIVLVCIFLILSGTIVLKYVILNPKDVINFVEIEEEKIKWNFKNKELPEYFEI